MKYKRIEDLPVWRDAIDLAVHVYSITSRSEFTGFHSLKDQLERAAVSISNNIAEGFERGTNNELLAFLYIARGSAGEVRSMSHLLLRISPFTGLANEIKVLEQKVENCSRQLKGWAQSIQNSDFRGERHVNRRTKEIDRAAREREEFLKELAGIRAKGAKAGASNGSQITFESKSEG